MTVTNAIAAAKCPDEYTYMRTELECEKPQDCMKGQEDESGADERALCAEYFERNVAQKKRCCPIGYNVKAYCTKRKCSTFSDCNAGQYCEPSKEVCCYIGDTKLDGSKHEKGEICQGPCSDKEVRVKDRDRTVNPVYKAVFIISVILTVVFAFLAVIMFVNYRSKNFCDKYTPKKKKKRSKKSKKSKKDKGEGGGGTEGAESSTGGVSGTSGTGATGEGTSGAGGAAGGAGEGPGAA
ncbi:unnamed protein product [Strongylus vulgaris]|uniref:Uncharacterized protein n=1 Tax=Strongylus vulgaris TaxID=40348 RepID=A0A3P7JVN6_STRVU|nr:unnamed protein product [Strongylus vulgaris]